MDLDFVSQLIGAIENPQDQTLDQAAIVALRPHFETMLDNEVDQLMNEFVQRRELLTEPGSQMLLEFVFATLGIRAYKSFLTQPEPLSKPLLASIESIYRAVEPGANSRNHLLAWLATTDDPSAMNLFTDLMVDDPPMNDRGIAIAFQPFFRSQGQHQRAFENLFPRLLDAVQHIGLAAGVLDLANFLTRQNHVTTHPATERKEALVSILDRVTHELEQIEQGNIQGGADPVKLSGQIENSVVLVVSLCDALGLISNDSAIPALQRTCELRPVSYTHLTLPTILLV